MSPSDFNRQQDDTTSSRCIVDRADLDPAFEEYAKFRCFDHRNLIFEHVRTNTPYHTEFSFSGCSFLPISAWRQVGLILASNDHVTLLNLGNCQLSVESFKALLVGLKQNTSLRNIILDNNPGIVTSEGIETMSSYLHHPMCALERLQLQLSGLNDEGLRNLIPVLNKTEIKYLDLCDNHLGDSIDKVRVKDNLSFVFSQWDMPEMETLTLVNNKLGREESEALAILIQKNDLKLKKILLNRNMLDDECCSILADALKHNAYMKELDLWGNDDISPTGWNHFLQLTCDDTSIGRTYVSNHTILDISPVCHDCELSNYELPDISLDVPFRLQQMLKLNACSISSSEKGRQKVARIHFKDEFDLTELLSLNVELMPYVLEWVMKECGFQALHRLIRNWNVAEMFGFPSAESQRIGSCVNKLESEAIDLKSTNTMMEGKNASLEELVRRLQIKVSVLEEENEQSKERNANADCVQKKQRVV